MFHQIEGLCIEPHITMAHLKGCLLSFLRQFFGMENLKMRFVAKFRITIQAIYGS